MLSTVLRKILVTCALPYANGPIHIGHMLEHIQADIWVRYQRMRGHEVWFVSADDAHGTAIMLKSENLGISSNQLIKNIRREHQRDFINFKISYDNYYSTHSIENLYLLRKIFSSLNTNGLIQKKIISQFYDNIKNIFLPDRFIKGTCPLCKSRDQYGDNCEICSSTYDPIDLINPISVISGTKPILKDTEHLYFNLPLLSDFLKKWIHSGVLENSVIKKTKEWFQKGLKPWGISRDAPYFGFKIPGFPNKYFYVWLDAPIGYISAFKNLCLKNKKLNFNSLWHKKSNYELYHFIGKDIIYFHTLFWPAILEAVYLRKPNGIFVHGYLTMNGLKLSKSRGMLITANDWLKCFDSDSLRYYYASKLSNNINDIEMDLEHFITKINSDIVNKLVNLASRNAYFINKYFNGYLSNELSDDKLYQYFINSSSKIEDCFENREFSTVIRESMRLIDIANQYINEKKPWKIEVKEENMNKLQKICTMGINLFRIVMIFLKPILPDLANKTELFLISNLVWQSIKKPLLSHKINKFKPLYTRISFEKISQLMNLYR
ncbi:Metg [Buchnera aphidicola str. G002 (Myzus persicae)]|uniref:Methionine--tRNA ligase n=1 Tax=Buchnera aphidicola str. USDA (Myzus persicae) TaxID=1009856 RepID=W0P4H0_BUCMP|nr:methionine--tRNA ligase [Buchnera aphidicola]AHG60260.1 Metg [Buchnera aphidicola str. USDA (Myzus persicae)]AHG60838.1 Metg [Buchnera aphidicola str. W106 (Myzus persicae)]AHG61410.1 Metg [Buchnera aphidicola str. G002 (Myzus persicae)]WAI03053.1 MAG: methionine--tRNA ligase [Buchnera aphidicola (Myzus persicae)]